MLTRLVCLCIKVAYRLQNVCFHDKIQSQLHLDIYAKVVKGR